jgi:hypothetical protein
MRRVSLPTSSTTPGAAGLPPAPAALDVRIAHAEDQHDQSLVPAPAPECATDATATRSPSAGLRSIAYPPKLLLTARMPAVPRRSGRVSQSNDTAVSILKGAPLSRRWMLRTALLAGIGTAALACRGDSGTDALPLDENDGPPVNPSGAALFPPGTPPLTRSEVDLTVAEADIRRFLQETLTTHQTYFASVRQEQGNAAAQADQATVSAPFQERIAQIQAAPGRSITLRVPIVTLWNAISVSATAYEGPLTVKDPVSMLFYWQGDAARIYDRSVDLLSCRPDRDDDCRRDVRFMDEDARQGIPGHPFECHTSPQWVLMGNAGSPLQWVKNSGGLMKNTDRCNRVGRDHIRLFPGPRHPVLGQWSVATPHKERFSFDVLAGKGGHIITSWNRAQHLDAGAWIESGQTGDRRGWDPTVFYWNRFDWGTGGDYQTIPFDGQGITIGLIQPS